MQIDRFTAATALQNDAAKARSSPLEGRLETKAEVVEFLGEIATMLHDDYDLRGPSESELSIKVTNRAKRGAAVWATLDAEDSYYAIVMALDPKTAEAGAPVPHTFGFWASTNNARLIAERIRKELGHVMEPSI